MSRRGAGDRGERAAALFLERSGMEILGRNIRAGRGELDIVARDGPEIVFIEVKAKMLGLSRPAEAITANKVYRLSTAALDYLSKNGLMESGFRFDVVEIYTNGDSMEIQHIRAAFDFDARALRG